MKMSASTKQNNNSVSSLRKPIKDFVTVGSGTALILLVPFTANSLSDEVTWSGGDFFFAGILLFMSGTTYRLLVRQERQTHHRAGIALALLSTVILIWTHFAVGLIGTEDNPANLMYLAVLAVLIVGGVKSHFNPRGLAITLFASVAVQSVITLIALANQLDSASQLLMVNSLFIILFGLAGALLRCGASR